MRIAQVAPLYESVPPVLYGGTERVVSYLTEALVARGHDVTLFASGDSVTAARLEPMWPKALRLHYGDLNATVPTLRMIEEVRRRADTFDVIHFHLDFFPFSTFSRQSTPYVTTLHGPLSLPEQDILSDTFGSMPIVSISHAQRVGKDAANWVGNVYHGLPVHLHTPREIERSYLAFLGRITPTKGIDKAIRIAEQCNVPLKIAAKIDSLDESYFEHQIRPLLNSPLVEFIGEIDEQDKTSFLSGARALLFPIDWPEPFGLVMIEAMACGTPVIAFRRGSVPEVIEEGVTGFVVADEDEAAAAVQYVDHLSHPRIRKAFERRFTSDRMADDYLRIYQSLMDR
ncbi:glycosyltransferase family 4 protein [Luteibacter sp. UNCMF366Tsu5.1]|uniref:glycosyltransferase family 4 protein n=1 Tax=Luteibacter sp. UNCMF366Tsu5.1 TaxID=1502758 RepID=UPI0009090CF3|nr:glycosyltransferase family 4 protein [Luteibacter sp. UNCMF366Tsu5.1]SFW44241.1 Glycosyltransferase involved in cell wall bisynthesis [Luteibacter sp. UNCMF366Tsu5.1]